jgi:ABC-type nitrate/sulfonate/bicarbonate transport system substrate-binding protein
MIDGAPLMVAEALGLFRKYGVDVRLSREVGWASIRDLLIHQEIVGAHAPATMALGLRSGLGSLAVPCLTAIVLSHNGSAITLSHSLFNAGVTDAASLATFIRSGPKYRKLRFAAVFAYATQLANLRNWLSSAGLDVDRDVEVVLLPSPLVHRSLASRHIDGFCVAEPWNSVAESEGSGWIACKSAGGEADQPEKVFLVLEHFEKQFPQEHLAMIAALQEAGTLCEDPRFRPELVRLLSQPRYLDLSDSVIERSLPSGVDALGTGHVRFGAGQWGVPTRTRGRAVFDLLQALGVQKECRGFRRDIIPKVFREDLYHRALEGPPFSCPVGAAKKAALASQPSPEELRNLAA